MNSTRKIYIYISSTISDFEIRPEILIFFRKSFFQPYKRARRVGHENRSLRSQKLTLDFKKKS